jgi:pre-mRNA-splicing factor 18
MHFQANDAYLEMAIGNAPWPIGVTMVGIHARTGREKIFARNVAHVLNDETQRKYIQVNVVNVSFGHSLFTRGLLKIYL